MQSRESTGLSINRDHCEDEPIRFTPAIQPSGVLLCVDAQTGIILAASANHALIPALQAPLLGRLFADVWPELALGCRSGTFNIGDGYIGRSHADDRTTYIEIEPCHAADRQNPWDLAAMGEALLRIHDAQTLEQVTDEAASAIRRVTGMERVLIYRFDQDGHGEVIAESKVGDWDESFIGFHFPSADIPSQARELYLISPCRFVEKRDYDPVPLSPGLDTRNGQPFDLARCRLRSLSPMHRLYQENLGVDGAMSVSIIDDGRLWGLVVGHHRHPHRVTIPAREYAIAITTSLAMRLAATESADDRAAQERHVILHAKLLNQIAGADDFISPLIDSEVKLADMFFTAGSLVLVNADGDAETPKVFRVGRCPDPDLIVAFCNACRTRLDDGIFHTDHAASVLPAFAAHADYASGVLAASLGKDGRDMVLWFRPETIRTISWGGVSPEQVEKEKAAGNYLPRKSFKRWIEKVRGHSLPWRPWQIDIARSLRSALNDLTIRQLRTARNQEINAALRRTNASLEARTADLEAANAELTLAREHAEAGSKAKSEFLSVMNHEFHTPLNAIIGFAEVLSSLESTTPTDPKLGAFSTRIIEGGRSLLTLLDDILSLSTLASGDLSLEFDPFPLARLTEAAIAIIEVEAVGAQVKFAFDTTDPSIQIDGDEEALLKALVHILRNAIKFSKHDGEVKLRVERVDDDVHLVVTDDGIGIPDFEKAQAPFAQADSSITRRYGGIGIGLPLAQRLIEYHGGTLKIRSAIGVGTTVTIRIPKERIITGGHPAEDSTGSRPTGALCIMGKRAPGKPPVDSHYLSHLADCVEEGLALFQTRANEKFLKTITDAIPAMVAYWDQNLRCNFANKAYLDWFGRPPEAVIGKTLQDLLGERLFLLNEPHIHSALAGRPQSFERQLTKADGTRHDTWANYIPDIDEDGSVHGFFVLVSDVTQMKASEQMLKETEGYLHAILDNIKDGIIATNRSGCITSINAAVSTLFGYQATELIGQNIKVLIPEPYRSHHDTYVAQYQSAGKSKVIGAGRKLLGLTKQGVAFPIELTITEMASQGQPVFIGLVRGFPAPNPVGEG